MPCLNMSQAGCELYDIILIMNTKCCLARKIIRHGFVLNEELAALDYYCCSYVPSRGNVDNNNTFAKLCPLGVVTQVLDNG